jgi:hypothetical protein
MPTLEDDLETSEPAASSPAPVEDLIPEVRQHTRRRRRRNLAIVILAGALAAALIAITGSGSPASHQTGRSPSPSAAASAHSNRSSVIPKQPADLAIGPTGVLYLADDARQQILRRLTGGRFQVVAGTGVAGYSGDGQLSTQAEIDYPDSLVVAPNGTLYFTQASRTKDANGLPDSVVREITPSGKITTLIGRHPNCDAVPRTSTSVPAESAEFDGAQLTIGRGGALGISTTVCPNILDLGGYLQLTSSGELVRTAAGSIPIPRNTPGNCGAGTSGRGFIAFGCASGARRGPRLMVVRANGSTKNYPDHGSQQDDMSVSDGTVVAIHNGAIVRVGANGLRTIATQRQLIDLVPGATSGWPGVGIANDLQGNVYVDQDFLIARHGCADVIFEIKSSGLRRSLWRSARTNSCY